MSDKDFVDVKYPEAAARRARFAREVERRLPISAPLPPPLPHLSGDQSQSERYSHRSNRALQVFQEGLPAGRGRRGRGMPGPGWRNR